jgi:hypothetical protein
MTLRALKIITSSNANTPARDGQIALGTSSRRISPLDVGSALQELGGGPSELTGLLIWLGD